MATLYSIYCQFIEDCLFPLIHVIHYFGEICDIHVYTQLFILILFLPLHLVLFIPSAIFGIIVGVPVALYKYIYCNDKKNKNGTLEITNRSA